ncbi:hypothetical protein BN7_5165 [Wickerhamomyces ciferrii]|uniref:Uncharacterized protein n=1 Tax=Wickerhamomyces ciferrii (strain ATCC 14091 / BCRC 22168 / CBS 111 / JCM 3599 / NBRC 0793 / NRRL Y-1031 F-60-10) TaxID=1206466 RepID=K0KWV5_WICCF|nr:uncharacterized protein BN7_5165 [Wickerhamomyces ciferrii]CCH45583.1 hypothetical protein BN7_5165 [Wickerhamomyces ciferrii]
MVRLSKMISNLKNLLIGTSHPSEMNDDLAARSTKGYNTILSLTDEELIGTLCLESASFKDSEVTSRLYQCHQSDRFIAALCDPRTSFEYKINEIFQVVEPQNVEYIKFSVKLKLKIHPTKALSEENIRNIRVYLDSCGSAHHFTIFMKPDLNLPDVLTYLNQVGSLKSDKDVDDDICKINSERLPRILILISNPKFFKCFHKLLSFYSNNSLETSSCSRKYRLIGKVIQKQSSKYIYNIKGTIPHRNCVYFFIPLESQREECINDDFIKRYFFVFEKMKLENPSSDHHRSYSIYDMECANDQINIKAIDYLNS